MNLAWQRELIFGVDLKLRLVKFAIAPSSNGTRFLTRLNSDETQMVVAMPLCVYLFGTSCPRTMMRIISCLLGNGEVKRCNARKRSAWSF